MRVRGEWFAANHAGRNSSVFISPAASPVGQKKARRCPARLFAQVGMIQLGKTGLNGGKYNYFFYMRRVC
jgi:hypothetical protein